MNEIREVPFREVREGLQSRALELALRTAAIGQTQW